MLRDYRKTAGNRAASRGIFLACLFLILAMPPPVTAEPSGRVLTLEETASTALHNSQDLLAIQEQINLAQHRISEARSQIYPKIDFNLNISKFANALPTVLPPSFNSVYLPDKTEDIYYLTRFSLWQYLYAGGRYHTNVRLAEINLSQAQSQYEAVKKKIIREAKKSFYAFLVANEKVKAYERTLGEVQALGEKGASLKARWSPYAIQLKRELAVARHEREKGKLRYLDTLGLELDTMVDIKGDLAVPQEEYDLNKCLARAFQYRPELRQTQFEETMDSLKVNLSLTERNPTVTLGANYEWVGNRFPLTDKNWNATLNLNVPVFDGWASWARIKQRRNEARESKLHRARIEDQIRFEVREAFMDYTFWKNQIPLIDAQQTGELEPDKKLETSLLWLDTVQRSLSSQATLDWAIGKSVGK